MDKKTTAAKSKEKAVKKKAEAEEHAPKKHAAAKPKTEEDHVHKKPAEKKEEAAAEKKPVEKKTTPAAKKHPAEKKEKTEEGAKEAASEEKPAAKKKAAPKKKEIPVETIEFLGETKEIERKKKPKFIRQEFYKLARLKEVWRKPQGLDSKKHEKKRGKGYIPEIGYKNAEEVRGLHPTGLLPAVVHNEKEMEKIDSKTQGAVIARAVGRKKRNEMIKTANKLKITILNPRKGEVAT